MALLDLNHGAARSNPASGVGAFLNGVKAYFAQRALYRQTVNELSGLNDRELADLGISRFDIPAIARSSVRGN